MKKKEIEGEKRTTYLENKQLKTGGENPKDIAQNKVGTVTQVNKEENKTLREMGKVKERKV